MSEEQKYQGALYKAKLKKFQQQKPADSHHQPHNTGAMAQQQPYIEDIGEDGEYESWHDYEAHTEDGRSPAEPPPEAPTPPSAANDDNVNVFDYMVATGQTPNASNMNLLQEEPEPDCGESTSLVRYEPKPEKHLDPISLMEDDAGDTLVEYGSVPVPTDGFVTPGAKLERRKTKDGELKKDKKRKRLHVDVPGDQIMTDAPPVLHSGLTGGLKSLMRPVFPPSPDYSGGDVAEISPASPLKKTKHSKHSKNGQLSNSIFGMIAGGNHKVKSKKQKTSRKHSHRHRDEKEPKLIEYRPNSKDGKDEAGDNQMIVFKPRADVFLGFVNKGPDSDRGCSMNKALKRFHRERQAAGSSMPKGKEEKELWRSLRLRRNERGEIVLFTV